MSGADVSTTLNLNTRADTSGTQAMTSALAALQQQMGAMSTVMSQMSQSSAQLAQSFANLTKTTQGEQEALAKGGDALNQHKDATDKASQSTSAFTQMIGAHATQIIGLGAAYLSIRGVLELVGQGFEFITSAAEAAIGRMEQFLQQSFQLSQEAQQMEYLWGYQYGGPQGGGTQIASQLQAWIPNFAMNSPYTMMQIMGAVGPLSQLGLSFQGLQRYLPLISDLAATHTSIFGGGGMLPLPYAALAVMEATKGYSRRLLMELQIRPNELEPYGLKFVGNKDSGQISNPDQFLPALEAYAKDKGYLGASKKMAHESVTGLEASLQDRFQSFMRRTIGENIPDPDAGNLSQAVLNMLKTGDIKGAMKATGADIASLKGYGVAFGKNGMPTNMSEFQDALQSFSHDKFYSDWATKGRLSDQDIKYIKSGNWRRAMMDVGADKDSLMRYGATFDSKGNPINMGDFQYALEKVSIDLHGNPEFKKGSIFDIILKGMQDFSSWWDGHQSMLDKVSKFVAEVGGKFLELGAQGVSSFGNAFGDAFVKKFNGTQWQGLGNDFMSWISDPHNQELLKQAGDYIGKELAQDLDLLASGIDNLRIGWDSLPQEWKTGTTNFLGFAFDKAAGALNTLIISMSFFGSGLRQIGIAGQMIGKQFENFFEWRAGNQQRTLQFVADMVQLTLDFKKLLTDPFNDNLYKQISADIQKATKDLQNFVTATQAPWTAPAGKTPPHKSPPGHGTGVDPNAYASGIGPNVTQNNTYNIQGATQWNIQALINANAKKVNAIQNRLWQSPGALAFGSVGLF